MFENDNLCLGCMNEKNGERECPICGYYSDSSYEPHTIMPGTKLSGNYLIGKKLSQDSVQITYIAFDYAAQKAVEIHEFYPSSLCARADGSSDISVNDGTKPVFIDYLADFLENSRALARLKSSPAIVKVIDVFEANKTGYTVCEYSQSETLRQFIERKEKLPWEDIRKLMMPVITSIAAAHSIGLMHFGISPDTLVFNEKSRLKINGYSVPEAYLLETELCAEPTSGFAALEQYVLEGRKGKWTDVYAISAVIFFMLTGKNPPDAPLREEDPSLNIPKDLAVSLPTHVVTALAHGLQVQPDDRTRSAEKFKEEIFAGIDIGEPIIKPITDTIHIDPPSAAPPIPAQAKGFTRNVSNPHKINKNIPKNDTPIKTENRKKRKNDNLKLMIFSGGATAAVLILIITLSIFVINGGEKPAIGASTDDNSSVQEIVSEVSSEELTIEVSSALSGPLTNEVPNFVGKRVETAQQQAGTKISVTVEDNEFSDEYNEGYIISQDIPPKTKVADGTVIKVIVSKGSQMREIPKIIGKKLEDAVKMIEDEGLNLGEQIDEFSSTVAKGRIIGIVDYEEGDILEYGTEIDIIVSKGPEF